MCKRAAARPKCSSSANGTEIPQAARSSTIRTLQILIGSIYVFPNIVAAFYGRCMDVVVCNPLRTPVGRMGGWLAALTAADLATATLRALISRTGLGEEDIDDVIVG